MSHSGSYDRMKTTVQQELKQHFRPEFLNRVDDTIVFRQLSREEITAIVDLMIAKVDERLKDRDMGLELLPAARTLLSERGYDPVARRQAAPPHDPAGDRGQPVREDPVRRAEGRPDRHGRCGGHRAASAVHVQGRAQARRAVPDTPPAEIDSKAAAGGTGGRLTNGESHHPGSG